MLQGAPVGDHRQRRGGHVGNHQKALTVRRHVVQEPPTLSEGPSRLLGWVESTLAQGWRKILLNMLEAPFIDSEGLLELVRAHRAARDKGAALKFCVAPRVSELLAVTRVDQLLETFDSEPKALDSFGQDAV